MASMPPSELLTVQDLYLQFPVRPYTHTGLRDAFVEAFKHPWDFIVKRPDILAIINGVNFTIHKGDRIGLIGVNGAGKSTLCRMLCGMIRPSKGKIHSSAQVEAIFDIGTGIMPELTGRENAYLLARLFFNSGRVDAEMVEEALAFSELGPFLDVAYKTYSKGMQARLVLSLVSARPSEILILDEVFDGADVFFRQKISERMKKKIKESQAVVFVSHGPDQILELCNRVMVLSQGKIVFDGNPKDGVAYYLDNPDNSFKG